MTFYKQSLNIIILLPKKVSHIITQLGAPKIGWKCSCFELLHFNICSTIALLQTPPYNPILELTEARLY